MGPGEVLLIEKPYSSILLPEYYSSHCQTCFQRVLAPMPCWCCSKVRFCSDECRCGDESQIESETYFNAIAGWMRGSRFTK